MKIEDDCDDEDKQKLRMVIYHADIEDGRNDDDDDDDVEDDFEDVFEEETFIVGRDMFYCFIREGGYLFIRGYLCYRRILMLWRISKHLKGRFKGTFPCVRP